MFYERKIGVDVPLPNSGVFVDVPDALAGFGFDVHDLKEIVEFYLEGTFSAAIITERVDIDILLQKDDGVAKRISSGVLGGGVEKAAGLGGVVAQVAAAKVHLNLSKLLALGPGLYKAKVQYRIAGAGAGTVEGATHDLRWGVQFTQHKALLAVGEKPQNQIQV